MQTQIAPPRPQTAQNWLTSSAAAALVGLDRDQLRYRARTQANHPQPLRLNSRVFVWDADALVKFYAARCE